MFKVKGYPTPIIQAGVRGKLPPQKFPATKKVYFSNLRVTFLENILTNEL